MKKVDPKTAKEILISGEVVAIPTETVYGLGGWIYSDKGLKRIFSTKERPFFDPLIVHVDGIESAKKLTSNWTRAHEALARAAWPGPLTLIAKKNEKVSSLITSGLDSVGLRCPDHLLTLELLRSIEGGIAAPSANKFGKTSPTQSSHVYDEFGEAVPIIEGGPSEVGIESTVVGIKESSDYFMVEIFRPGHYTSQRIERILNEAGLKCRVQYAESPVAPGQLKHHYMPKIPLVIVPLDFQWEKDHERVESLLGKKFLSPAHWVQPQDAHLASRELYSRMRSFDEEGHDLILISRMPNETGEEWFGIWNRLEKAKSLSL